MKSMEKVNNRPAPGQVNLRLPAEMSFLTMATNMTRDYAALVGLSEDDLYKTLLTVEEIVVNIICHGFDTQVDSAVFDMLFSVSQPYGLCIRINDKGIPFDPSTASRYEPNPDLAQFQLSGLGMRLVQNMMDQVEYRNLGRNGKEVVLTKYCPQPIVRTISSVRAWEDHAITEPASIPEVKFTIRRLQPQEAIEVSRCAYKCHGYTFFNDVIYYPEQIRALNETNRMISVVAVTHRGEVIGHGAMLFAQPDTHIAEVDFVFVDLKYRQHNCLGQLSEFLIRTAHDHSLAGLYTYTITLHVFSQKAAAKMGLSPVAILLATSPATWDFKGIAGNLKQRISSVLYFRYLRPPCARRIYLPSHHSIIIQKVYATLGATHDFANPSVESPTSDRAPFQTESAFNTEVSRDEGTAEIWVLQPGSEMVKDLRMLLRKLCTEGVPSIILFLSMEIERVIRHIEEIENLGFFFAGVLPETSIGDALVMQYLNNVDFDYASINLLPGESEILLKAVHSCDPNQD